MYVFYIEMYSEDYDWVTNRNEVLYVWERVAKNFTEE